MRGATLSAGSSAPAVLQHPGQLFRGWQTPVRRRNVAEMIIYEVTSVVLADAVAAYESYMRDTHIPNVLATGCFVRATIARSMPGRYRIRYEARNMDVLDRYLGLYAPQFRADFAAHLGSNVQVIREVWSELQHWTAAPDASH